MLGSAYALEQSYITIESIAAWEWPPGGGGGGAAKGQQTATTQQQ